MCHYQTLLHEGVGFLCQFFFRLLNFATYKHNSVTAKKRYTLLKKGFKRFKVVQIELLNWIISLFFYCPSVVLTDLLLRQMLYISCSFLRKVCIFGRNNSLHGQKRGKKRTSLLKAVYFREAQIVNDSTINSFNCV